MVIMYDFTQTLIHYKIAIVLLVLIIIFVLGIVVLIKSGCHHSKIEISLKWED
tara:strand:+ start:28 stop:186 length:159 start_codon:yes stop_codon:yes gene_type:complete